MTNCSNPKEIIKFHLGDVISVIHNFGAIHLEKYPMGEGGAPYERKERYRMASRKLWNM